ncbi:MAG: geranylgeranyl reductase family protein [Methanocellales archaeon]|nr:geranylgeranyl reductase family protein [Methanocellales archaeon]
MMNRYDVVVVGAGPAGATAARRCSLFGLSTLLIEAKKLPRHKLCGGAVTEKALAELGFALDHDLIESEIYGVTVSTTKVPPFTTRSNRRIMVLVSRDKFDHFLANKAADAGAEVLDGERVVGVRVNNEDVSIKTDGREIHSKIVIGADGINSTVARETGLRERVRKALCMVTEVNVDVAQITDPRLIRLYFGVVKNGYGWIFPKRYRLNIGVGSPHLRSQVFHEFIGRLDLGLDFSKPMAYHTPIWRKGEFATKRTMLAGDAAGFVDAFTGEGICYAIKSGRLCAETALEAVASGEYCSTLKNYARRCCQEIGAELRLAYWMNKIMSLNYDWCLGIGRGDPTVANKFLDVIRGNATYKELLQHLMVRVPVMELKHLSSRFGKQKATFK